MKVSEFVDAVARKIKPSIFKKLCRMAKNGEMGFGDGVTCWGDYKKHTL